jgi:hypothetical protein
MPNINDPGALTTDDGSPLSLDSSDPNTDAGFDAALRAAASSEKAPAEKPAAVNPATQSSDDILSSFKTTEASNKIEDGLVLAEKPTVITAEERQRIEQAERRGAELIAADQVKAHTAALREEELHYHRVANAARTGDDGALVAALANARAAISPDSFEQLAYSLAAQRAGVDPAEWSQLDDYEADEEASWLSEELAALHDAVDSFQGQLAHRDANQTAQRLALEAEVARGTALERHYASLGAKSEDEIVAHWERDVRYAAANGLDLRAAVANADPRRAADLVQAIREHRGQVAADIEADRIRADVLGAGSTSVSDGLEGWTAYGYQPMAPRYSVEANRSAEELVALVERRVEARAKAPKTVGEFRAAVLAADNGRDIRDGFTDSKGRKLKVSEIDGSAEEARRRAEDDRAADRMAGVRGV